MNYKRKPYGKLKRIVTISWIGFLFGMVFYWLWSLYSYNGKQTSNVTLNQSVIINEERNAIEVKTVETFPLPSSSIVHDISKSLLKCNNNNIKLQDFAKEYLVPRFQKLSKPTVESDLLNEETFVCSAKCSQTEPELEQSLRYLGSRFNNVKYSFSRLATLCRRELVPFLVRITATNEVYWTACQKKKTIK